MIVSCLYPVNSFSGSDGAPKEVHIEAENWVGKTEDGSAPGLSLDFRGAREPNLGNDNVAFPLTGDRGTGHTRGPSYLSSVYHS